MNNNILTYKLRDTFSSGEFQSIFDLYYEYLIKESVRIDSDLTGINIFCYRTVPERYVSAQIGKTQINEILQKDKRRHQVISKFLSNFNYSELSEIEFAYFQYQKYSPDYQITPESPSELIIRKSTCSELSKENDDNFEFLMTMFKDVGKLSYYNKINTFIDSNCN